MSRGFAWERFYQAVMGMAKSPKSLPDRLHDAFLCIAAVRADDLPPALQGKYRLLRRTLTRRQPAEHEGSLSATTAQMSQDQAAFAANLLVDLYDEIAAWDEEDEHEASEEVPAEPETAAELYPAPRSSIPAGPDDPEEL